MIREEAQIFFTTNDAINALKKIGFVDPSTKYLILYFTRVTSIKGERWVLKYDLDEVKKAFEEGQIFERLSIYVSLKANNVPSRFQHFENIKGSAREILDNLREVDHAKA